METCYDYFACKEKECIMFKNQSGKPCWETKGTSCCFPSIKVIENISENDKCDFCLYRNEHDLNHIPTHKVFELQQLLLTSSIVYAPPKSQHPCCVLQQGTVYSNKNAGLGD